MAIRPQKQCPSAHAPSIVTSVGSDVPRKWYFSQQLLNGPVRKSAFAGPRRIGEPAGAGVPASAKKPSEPRPKVAGIVLAAGLSKRMGSPKLAIRVGGMPLLEWVIRATLESSLDHVVLVEGPNRIVAAGMASYLLGSGKLTTVVNREPARGMASSMIAGLRSSAPGLRWSHDPLGRSAVCDRFVD